MSNYTKGRSREYRVVYRLRKEGALDVQRSYGSHTLFDIRAVFPDRVLLIQVKKDRIPKDELKRLREFASRIRVGNIIVQVWIFHGSGAKPKITTF